MTCTYEDVLSGFFLFSCFDSHGYREIFSPAGERAGLREVIKCGVTALQNNVDKSGARRLLRPEKHMINRLQPAATTCPQEQNVTFSFSKRIQLHQVLRDPPKFSVLTQLTKQDSTAKQSISAGSVNLTDIKTRVCVSVLLLEKHPAISGPLSGFYWLPCYLTHPWVILNETKLTSCGMSCETPRSLLWGNWSGMLSSLSSE